MLAASLAPATTDPAALPLLSEALAYLGLEQDAVREAAEAGEADAGPSEEKVVSGSEAANVEAAEATSAEASGPAQGEETGEAGAADKTQEEAEAKREAKQRERDARVAVKQVLDELIAEYAADGRGIEIREVAGGYRMATKPEFHDAVRSFVKSLKPPLKLSLPALETLAVIAYKQPVTAPEVNEIRGVDSSGVFGSLLARKLIVTAGRKPVIGRPILYKTTREFLLRFGLKDVSELPSMDEFEKMAASELDETEPAQEDAATNGEVAESQFRFHRGAGRSRGRGAGSSRGGRQPLRTSAKRRGVSKDRGIPHEKRFEVEGESAGGETRPKKHGEECESRSEE